MTDTRILLVDDHTVLCEGVTALIHTTPGLRVVAHASSGEEALLQAQQWHPDIVLLDLSLPDGNGIRIIQPLRQLNPAPAVIVLTRHSEVGFVKQAFAAGARGYMLKQSAATELITALRKVAAGETYLDTSLTSRIATSLVTGMHTVATSQGAALSDRESDVVRLIALGYTNKEVAAQLNISVKTVDTYKTRAMDKLQLYGRAALVRYALQQGWFDHIA